MATKTGSRLVISTLAMAALWAAPAGADQDACYEELNYCIERANEEPVDWIRDYKLQDCQGWFYVCMGTTNCGDNYCDMNWETSYYCPADCH